MMVVGAPAEAFDLSGLADRTVLKLYPVDEPWPYLVRLQENLPKAAGRNVTVLESGMVPVRDAANTTLLATARYTRADGLLDRASVHRVFYDLRMPTLRFYPGCTIILKPHEGETVAFFLDRLEVVRRDLAPDTEHVKNLNLTEVSADDRIRLSLRTEAGMTEVVLRRQHWCLDFTVLEVRNAPSATPEPLFWTEVTPRELADGQLVHLLQSRAAGVAATYLTGRLSGIMIERGYYAP